MDNRPRYDFCCSNSCRILIQQSDHGTEGTWETSTSDHNHVLYACRSHTCRRELLKQNLSKLTGIHQRRGPILGTFDTFYEWDTDYSRADSTRHTIHTMPCQKTVVSPPDVDVPLLWDKQWTGDLPVSIQCKKMVWIDRYHGWYDHSGSAVPATEGP